MTLSVLVMRWRLHHTISHTITLFVRWFIIFWLRRWHRFICISIRWTHMIRQPVIITVVMDRRVSHRRPLVNAQGRFPKILIGAPGIFWGWLLSRRVRQCVVVPTEIKYIKVSLFSLFFALIIVSGE